MRCNRPKSFKTGSPSDSIVPNKEHKILWHIDESYVSSDIEKFKIIAQIQKAFNAWQPYFSPIIFESTSSKAEAPIVLRFMHEGNKKLPSPFGPGTLAYAYFPDKQSLGIHSDVYFNDQYNWAEMHSDKEINLFKVAVHELGHAFGIDHNNIKKDIMYPEYQPNDSVNIGPDTQGAIEHLYGKYKKLAQPVSSANEADFISKLFPEVKYLEKLTEDQLVTLGKRLGAGANKDYLKTDNVKIIAKALKL